MGHVLESCPEDHGLKLTDCQTHRTGQTNVLANKTKPTGTGTGIDQLSVCFKNVAKSPPASWTSPVMPPVPRGPPTDDAGKNDTTIPIPVTATQLKCDEKTTELAQEGPPLSTQQPNQNTTTDANRLLSSLGVHTETGTGRTKPTSIKASPAKKKPERVPNELTKNTKTNGERDKKWEGNQNKQ